MHRASNPAPAFSIARAHHHPFPHTSRNLTLLAHLDFPAQECESERLVLIYRIPIQVGVGEGLDRSDDLRGIRLNGSAHAPAMAPLRPRKDRTSTQRSTCRDGPIAARAYGCFASESPTFGHVVLGGEVFGS
jgi:hypothetical protein